jgi:phenylacetate-coenzyme A ligase PaaK-like adenylate-forming protein
MSKGLMMDEFDRFVTDPRLRCAALEPHLASLTDDVLHLGCYRVMASSGSSGRKGIYVFDDVEWAALLAGCMRWMGFMGVRPTLPRRTRIATLGAPDAKHMTFRGASSMDVGLFASLRLPATTPLAEMVAQLQAFRPDLLFGYPSVITLVAAAQQAGELDIAPRVVCTTSELRTPEMTARIRDAWVSDLYDCLGLTETGIAGVDCAAHAGLHIFEDQCILEVVDADNRPVPDGESGAKVLVTSLYRRVQPIIRMEVSDLLSVTSAPCTCGRTFRRIEVLGGRADDILTLPTADDSMVQIQPVALRSALAPVPGLLQYQIEHSAPGLRLSLVVAADAAGVAAAQAQRALESVLANHGVTATPVFACVVPHIEREAGAGKFKLIRSVATQDVAARRA